MRRLALALAEAHLRSGSDVIAPQYLGRPAFIEELAATAEKTGADFIEIVLVVEDDEVRRRFHSRRRSGQAHPAAEVDDVDALITESQALLREIAASRPGTIDVDAHGDVATVAARVTAVVETAGR